MSEATPSRENSRRMMSPSPVHKFSTRSVKGDVRLTTLIDTFSFLKDLFEQKEILDDKTPDKGQCQLAPTKKLFRFHGKGFRGSGQSKNRTVLRALGPKKIRHLEELTIGICRWIWLLLRPAIHYGAGPPGDISRRRQRKGIMSGTRPDPPSSRLDSVSYERLRQQVLRRDSWRCQSCGAMSNLEIHHKQFRSHSGNDCEENLITMCTACHVLAHHRG